MQAATTPRQEAPTEMSLPGSSLATLPGKPTQMSPIRAADPRYFMLIPIYSVVLLFVRCFPKNGDL
jgi:hypothetical protein